MAKPTNTKAAYLTAKLAEKDKAFKWVPLDSPSTGGPPAFTDDQGGIMFRDARVTTKADAIQLITHLAVWFEITKTDLVDVA